TCILLPGAAVAGRLLGLKRWTGLDRFPVTLGLAGLAATLLAPPLWPLVPFAALAAIVPLPSRIEARLLPAIDVDEAAADEHEAERVRAAIEAALCAMARRRKTPWG